MRTTLTLEPDVAQDLERLRRATGKGLKPLINELLRTGLRERSGSGAGEELERPTVPVSCTALRVPPETFDSIGALLGELDEEAATGVSP